MKIIPKYTDQLLLVRTIYYLLVFSGKLVVKNLEKLEYLLKK